MIMNRLKFNEGGQPVYLDDLKLLQENDRDALSAVFSSIGKGDTTVLLETPAYIWLGEEKMKVCRGSAFMQGEFVSWEETTLSGVKSAEEVRLCVRRMETDSRIHEDGQSHNCVEYLEGYVSRDATGAANSVRLFGTATLGSRIRELIGYKEYVWKSLNVEFRNGYKGIVKYQDFPECYRVWIDIKSSYNQDFEHGECILFYSDVPFLQYCHSGTKAFTQTENGILAFHIEAFEGGMRADVSLPYDDVDSPSGLPVKIIFEIPK